MGMWEEAIHLTLVRLRFIDVATISIPFNSHKREQYYSSCAYKFKNEDPDPTYSKYSGLLMIFIFQPLISTL